MQRCSSSAPRQWGSRLLQDWIDHAMYIYFKNTDGRGSPLKSTSNVLAEEKKTPQSMYHCKQKAVFNAYWSVRGWISQAMLQLGVFLTQKKRKNSPLTTAQPVQSTPPVSFHCIQLSLWAIINVIRLMLPMHHSACFIKWFGQKGVLR